MISAALLMLTGQTLAATPVPSATITLSGEQRAAARRLLVATGASGRRGALIDDVVNRVTIFLRCRAPDPDGQQECAARERMYADIRRQVDAARPVLLGEIAEMQERAYAERLSIADMDVVSTFATTPAGRRFFDAAKPAGDEAYRTANLVILDRVKAIFDRAAANLPHPASVTDTKQ